MTSAVSTNLLLPHIQSDRQRPQKFNKSLSSGHTSTAEKKQQNRGVLETAERNEEATGFESAHSKLPNYGGFGDCFVGKKVSPFGLVLRLF